jgi:hypothetical protein
LRCRDGHGDLYDNSLSYYVVSYEEWTNPFADVKSADWFFDAVKYSVQNELFNGVTATAFEPNTNMTRAMLVTVLYRLDGRAGRHRDERLHRRAERPVVYGRGPLGKSEQTRRPNTKEC